MPQLWSWPLGYRCEFQSICSADLSRAVNVLPPLLDALPCSSPSTALGFILGFIHLIPVHLQLFLLDSQLTAPQLQLCLLPGWAWRKPMHYLPWTLSHLRLPKS